MPERGKSKLRPQLLGRMTRRAVAEELRRRGPLSRADITRLTGISPTTVSAAVASLLGDGMVEEGDAPPDRLGRPGKLLRLSDTTARVVGLAVGPEWCELVAAGLDGRHDPDAVDRFPTPRSYARLLERVEKHARTLAAGPARTRVIGLSLPGLIDRSSDQAVVSPNLHLTDGRRPAADLRDRLGVDTVLVQEVDGLCLAERGPRGAAPGGDVAVLDYTGGLGVGVSVGGQLLNRHLGLPGELGHTTVVPGGEACGCGNAGCLETVATDAALARAVARKAGRPLALAEALDLVRAGGVDAAAEVDHALDCLAVAAAAVVNLYGPPVLAMHGRFLGLAPGLIGELTERVRKRAFVMGVRPCRIVPSTATKADGAVAAALDHLFDGLGPRLSPAGQG